MPVGSTQFPPPLVAGRLSLKMDLPEPAPGDVIYQVEVSADLGSASWTPLATKIGAGAWTWVAGDIPRIAVDTPAGGRQTVYVGHSESTGTMRFIRMRVAVGM